MPSSYHCNSESQRAPRFRLVPTGQCTFPEAHRLETRIGDDAFIEIAPWNACECPTIHPLGYEFKEHDVMVPKNFPMSATIGIMIFPEAFHGHPVCTTVWIVTYGLCIVPEAVLSRRLRSGQHAQKLDRGSKLIVIVAANLAMVVGFVVAIVFPGFSVGIYWRTLFVAGIGVSLSGTFFRWYSIRTLWRFFTYDVAVSNGQHVVECGPYRWLRHPSYLGSLLAEIGFGMTLTNWLAIVLPALCLGAAYAYRIRIEEQALLHRLGLPYREYMRRTWRLVPFVF